MSSVLIIAVTAITMALIFYSIGVWSEHAAKVLKKWHVVIFWCGLACDTAGTTAMTHLAASGNINILHAVTGAAAILLMLVHAIWAAWTFLRGSEESKQRFHKFSIVVWCIWLVPFLSGMMMGMA